MNKPTSPTKPAPKERLAFCEQCGDPVPGTKAHNYVSACATCETIFAMYPKMGAWVDKVIAHKIATALENHLEHFQHYLCNSNK